MRHIHQNLLPITISGFFRRFSIVVRTWECIGLPFDIVSIGTYHINLSLYLCKAKHHHKNKSKIQQTRSLNQCSYTLVGWWHGREYTTSKLHVANSTLGLHQKGIIKSISVRVYKKEYTMQEKKILRISISQNGQFLKLSGTKIRAESSIMHTFCIHWVFTREGAVCPLYA